MTGFDLLLAVVVAAYVGYLIYKKKKVQVSTDKKASASEPPDNTLHGVHIVSFFYDSTACRDTDIQTDFDGQCGMALNAVLRRLYEDGHKPQVNAFSCVDRVIFYITY